MRRGFAARKRRSGRVGELVDGKRKAHLDIEAAKDALDESRTRARFERWAYLRSNTYQLRYKILCEYADREDTTLVEVGGYTNTVVDFISRAKRVHLIEPNAPPEFQAHIQATAKSKGVEAFIHSCLLSDFETPIESLGRYSFVMAGLDIMGENDKAE